MGEKAKEEIEEELTDLKQ